MVPLASLPAVRTWLRGVGVQHPFKRRIVPSWDLGVVLDAITRAPYYPLHLCTLKHLTLRTVFLLAITSARRASELHALTVERLVRHGGGYTAHVAEGFLPKVASDWHVNLPLEFPATAESDDQELRKLCVASSLDAYVAATQSIRADSPQLLVCYGEEKLGQPVSRQRVSTWLKEVILDAHHRQGVRAGHVVGHDTRRAAASWAHVAGVAPRTICEAAMWKSSNVFARHYKLDLMHSDHAEVGRRLLSFASQFRQSRQ